jgi:hypothetical protein
MLLSRFGEWTQPIVLGRDRIYQTWKQRFYAGLDHDEGGCLIRAGTISEAFAGLRLAVDEILTA